MQKNKTSSYNGTVSHALVSETTNDITMKLTLLLMSDAMLYWD